jgi:VCBS repeat-containing protein
MQVKEAAMTIETSDTAMRENVISELKWDPRIDADRIAVSAKDGAIVLSGHVPFYSERWDAVRAAERVYGVKAVADEIEVKLPTSSVRDDSDISEDIAHLIRSSTAVPDNVKAEVSNGHVTLRGEANWRYQYDEASRAVRHLPGVHNVSNQITIKPHLPKTADVDQRIGAAIERMADLDARSIWVTGTNGTVHLHGHVHSLAERRTAERAAASAPGVTHVQNEIVITP